MVLIMKAMNIDRSAVFSPCRTWRYTLDRHWNGMLPRQTILFILLNPSTADEAHDDPTNRRGLNFAERWGYNGCVFVNLFSVRTPNPSEMLLAPDPVGPDNDKWIVQRAAEAEMIVCAWGAYGASFGRAQEVCNLLVADYTLYHLGCTKAGEPRHLLYLAGDTIVEGEYVVQHR